MSSLASRHRALAWRELIFDRPLELEAALGAISALATDPKNPLVVLETRARAGQVHFLVGAEPNALKRVVKAIGATALHLSQSRRGMDSAKRLVLSTCEHSLNSSAIEVTTKAILLALNEVQHSEEMVLQLVLGDRISGLVVPSDARKPVPLYKLLWGYDPQHPSLKLDNEQRKSLIAKVGHPNFQATVRLGVKAATPERRRNLSLSVLGALRRLEVPGLHIDLKAESASAIGSKSEIELPWRLPLRLNTSEVVALSAWPVGAEELPGLPAIHPRLLAPSCRPKQNEKRFVIGRTTAPAALDANGKAQTLSISQDAIRHHLHVIGPTGVGKSVLLEHLALQSIEQGFGLVVIEPKGDLVEGILRRVPASRRSDVVVLDPTDHFGIVGLNPLSGSDAPEIRAERILAIFVQLFGDDLGVRTTDILHSCLLTLAQQSNASLVEIPHLLTDTTFRRKLTSKLGHHIALASFWDWYESLSTAERNSVIAPLMNKLRTLLLKPAIRHTLGQLKPRFKVSQVFAENKILLVSLPSAELGSLGASLLGSIVVSEIWEAAKQRSRLAEDRRSLVPIIIDECQNFMHLPLELTEALAMARSFGAGFILAHQHLSQLTPSLRSSLVSNVRSRIAFQCSYEDAAVLARLTSDGLEAKDFMALSAYEVYAAIMEQKQTQGYTSGKTLPPVFTTTDGKATRTLSAKNYGRSAQEIENEFLKPYLADSSATPEVIGKRKRRAL